MGEFKYKETFIQPSYEGLPPHVVVQYWDKSGALHASYFANFEDAEEFEREIKESKND